MVAAALGVLVLAFLVTIRPAESIAGSDVTVYESYGSKILNGAVPYRDFRIEYPPGATLMFALPAIPGRMGNSTEAASWAPVNEAGRRYYHGFLSIVFLLVAAILILTATTLTAMRRPARTVGVALAVVGSSPLLIGQVVPERFDVLPAALTAAALASSVRGHYRLGAAMLGLAAAVKIYPVLLLPVLAIVAVRQRGVRETIFVVGAAVGAAAALFAPFAILSFHRTFDSLRIQFQGGLQIESFASSVLVMTRHAFTELSALGLPPPSELTTQGAGGGLIRTDLVGPGVGATTIVMNVLLAVALCLLWISLARTSQDPREALLRYSAATVATVLVLGTVLSPQYVVWLVALVPLVGGRRGLAAMLFFVAAEVLTNVWIPHKYFEYQGELEAGPASILLARNLALLGAALVLAFPPHALRRGPPLVSRN